MLTSAIVPAINHVLRDAEWARQTLRAHQGKAAQVTVLPFSFTFLVTAAGNVEAAPENAVPAAEIELSPPLLLRLLAGSDAAAAEVSVKGDAIFAGDISTVARNLRYDIEEDLSRLVGDIAAHRIASVGRDFFAWQKSLFADLASSGAEFLTFERRVLPAEPDVRKFISEVDELRDAVARLEKKIERFEARKSPKHAPAR
jgi:ubiquinone biosynthesis protein UbiJ